MIAERRRAVVGTATIGTLCATLYAWLGSAVSSAPPRGIDAAARAVTGEAPDAACILTASCLWPALTAFGIAGCIVAGRVPAWRARIFFAILTTVVGWQTSNLLKDVFRRPRPEYWIVHHETSFAYSSGHAMFAVLVYWLWAVYVLRSKLPPLVRRLLAAALAAWGAGVIWSRLALGAHYPTDLLGGILLAATLLAAAAAITLTVAPRARIV